MAKDRNQQKRLQQKRAKKAAKRKQKAKGIARQKQRAVELPALLRRQDPVMLWEQESGLQGLAAMIDVDLGTAGRLVDDYVGRGKIVPIPQLWYPARVNELPVEALVEAVVAHGVHVDEESFRVTAANYRGARKLVRGAWHHETALPTTHDLFDLAAARFWAEWVPERASEEELEDLYSAWSIEVEEVGVPGAHADWRALWARARTTFTEEDHDLGEWSKDWDERGGLPYDIEHVCEGVEAAADEPWAGEAIAGVTTLLDQFPLPPEVHELVLAAWAHGKNALGERADAEARLAAFRAEHPGRALSYIVPLELSGVMSGEADQAAKDAAIAGLVDALPQFEDGEREQILSVLDSFGVQAIEV